MNTLRMCAACLAACFVPDLMAQDQLAFGRVEQFDTDPPTWRLQGTAFELVSSSVDLTQLTAFDNVALMVAPTRGRNGGLALQVQSGTPTSGALNMGNLRLGERGSWSVSGVPGAAVYVFIAPTETTCYQPVDVYGTWMLGSGVAFLHAGTIGICGSCRFDYQPPPHAQVGTSWTAQAVVIEGDALRLTNPDARVVQPMGEVSESFPLSGDQLADAVVPDDFATIQAAVDLAQDLNNNNLVEILVRGGVYDENVDIRRSNLELRGAPGNPPTIRGTGPDETLEVRRVTNVRLIHLQIENNAPPLGCLGDGLEIEDADSCTVTDLVVQNCNRGIELEDCSRVALRDSVVFRNLEDGLVIDEATDCIVEHNEITENGDRGISASRTQNLTLQNNQVNDNGEEGLRLRDGEECGTIRVLANQFLRNHENGARLDDVENLQLEDNDFSANLGNGLRLRKIEHGSVQRNRFFDNTEFGLRMHDVEETDFGGGATAPPGNNTFGNNGRGDIRVDGH